MTDSPTSYSLGGYGEMMEANPRMLGYVQALRQAVRPGCVVVDIGAGTGIFSLLACQLGAGHVHAVEPDDALLVGPAMAQANGCADRITFHQALSSNIELSPKADVIISDLRGVLPLFQHHLPAIIDARQRLLAPGGALIPRRDTLWAAAVEAPNLYRPCAEPWLENDFGLDLSAAQPMVVNTWRKARVGSEQLLVSPQIWTVLDYATIDQPSIAGDLAWTAQRSGTLHGVSLWFDADLAEGVGFSNAPDQPELIYGQAFFPMQKPVPVSAGDKITIQLRADLVAGDYIWSWNTEVRAASSAGSAKASFRQSTFLGTPISLARLQRHDAAFVPAATEGMDVDKACLALVDGTTPLGHIARALSTKFPGRFARWQDAMAHVADLLERCGHDKPAFKNKSDVT